MSFKKSLPSIAKVVVTIMLYLFSISNIIAQNKIDKAFDSIINSEILTKEKVMNLLTFAGRNRYVPATKKFIIKALEIASLEGENKKLLLANSYYALGNYHFFHSQIDSSLVALDFADENLSENDLVLKATIMTTRGGIYNKVGDVSLAITTQLKAKEILEKVDTLTLDFKERVKRRGNISTITNSLANLYLKIDDFDNALINYENAFKLTKALKNKPNAAIILSNKGELLNKMKKFEEALKVSKQAKQLKLEAKLPERFIAISNFHIGVAYKNLDSTALALTYFNQVLTQSRKKNYKRGEMMALSERGLINFELNKIKEAKEDCTIALEIAEKTNDSDIKIKSCDCLYKVENSLGNHEAALQKYERFTQLKDSVYNEKNIRNITKIGMQYEFDKKEAQQKLIIEKKNRLRNRLISSFIVLTIIALLIVIFYRKRHKYQRKITEQEQTLKNQEIVKLQQENRLTAINSMIDGQEKERARISNDLHDGLGGLLSSVKSHFLATQEDKTENQSTAKKTELLIDQACNEVRRISHNMMPHALVISGLKDGIKDITERLEIDNYDVTLEINQLPKLDATQEIMVYRLIQEIVANIKKHANAKSIFIQLYAHFTTVHLMVEDDGKGFDLSKINDKKGLGLQSIESRVAYLNGMIDWDTGEGKGTTININFPT
ncbi:tetratricopeptide repeat-containing sensor histidine kinase [Aureibaculum luteum]|uniref:tetratricopeptide repeat-containing sensor histidine kinase n=1 Tax=Aureibaculum luteum TaxID=1548456 RepID=UPI000E49D118|nr:sensor histidine kinase [Aureibaculum luteum]